MKNDFNDPFDAPVIAREYASNHRICRITLKNNTAEFKKAVLFGANFNMLHPNFGSDIGVEVSSNSTYPQSLLKSAYHTWSSNYINIVSDSKEQFEHEIKICITDANGKECHKQFLPDITKVQLYEGKYCYQAPYDFTVDGNTYIETQLLAGNKLWFDFFIKNVRIPSYSDVKDLKINIENTTDVVKTCRLFGFYKNLLTYNFGSDAGITVTPADEKVNYLAVMHQKNYNINSLQVVSDNVSQRPQLITVSTEDTFGTVMQMPILPNSNLPEDSGKIIQFKMQIDGEVELSFAVLPKTKLQITFNPTEEAAPTQGETI